MSRYKRYAWPALTLTVLFALVTVTLLELVFPQEAAGVNARLSAPEVRIGYYVLVLLLATSLAISLSNAAVGLAERQVITCKLFLCWCWPGCPSHFLPQVLKPWRCWLP